MKKSPEGKVARILDDFGINLVLDVGANIGQTGDKLRNAGYCGRIVSFEPVPSAHAALTEEAQRDERWDVAPRTAIGAAVGEAQINVSQSKDLSSILEPKETLLQTLPKTEMVEKVATPVTTIEAAWTTYCASDDRVFLKVDTQGFERQVLEGAKVSQKNILGVQLELSLLPLYEGEETYLTFLQDLHAMGLEPFMVWENYFLASMGVKCRWMSSSCVSTHKRDN